MLFSPFLHPWNDIEMRILITTPTFPPNKDGVSEAATIMVAGFLENGWQVDVATAPFDPPRSQLEWRGARIHEFTITGEGLPKNCYHGEVGKYRNFLEHGVWDVVVFHGHSWILYLALSRLSKIPGKKILVSHGFYALQWVRVPTFPWGLFVWSCSVYRAIEMFFWIRRLDRTVYLSERRDFGAFLDHWTANALGHPGRRVIPNGVDLGVGGIDGSGLRRDLGITSDQVMFLYVANYSRRKDQGYAARAFRAAKLANAVMVFIGSEFNGDSARFQAEDEALPESQKTGRVIWLERVDRNATLNAFAACDVFVLSADHEALPIALLEAMRESKPWISRDVGCISELPGGVCVHTECEMTLQMVHFSDTPELRASLGLQGRESVEKIYNSKHYVDSYCDLIVEIAGGSNQ